MILLCKNEIFFLDKPIAHNMRAGHYMGIARSSTHSAEWADFNRQLRAGELEVSKKKVKGKAKRALFKVFMQSGRERRDPLTHGIIIEAIRSQPPRTIQHHYILYGCTRECQAAVVSCGPYFEHGVVLCFARRPNENTCL